MSDRDELFQTSRPRAVNHVPHAATLVPSDVREQFVLTDEQLADEIRLMTDHFTDELFAMPEAVALTVGFEAFEGEGQPTHAAWVPERSLLVLGVPASEAVAIGRRYGQNAIVFGEHRHHARLLSCHRADTKVSDR